MSVARAREVLAGTGATVRDVALPGDETVETRMGSLRLEQISDDAVDVVAWDYGATEVLLRAHSLDEAVEAVLSRWGSTPDQFRRVSSSDLVAWRAETDERVSSLGLPPAGAVAETSLLPGMVVDRFGNLDGFLLYPAGQPLEQRSMPPNVIDPTRPSMGLLLFGVAQRVDVLMRAAGPAFGQPGGGPVFKLAEHGETVRDLVRQGALEQLVVVDPPGGP